MGHKRLISGLAGLGMLLASSVSAAACANGFMLALFFHKNPEAKAVSEAVASASGRGALQGDQWDISAGMSQHSWRAEKVESTIKTLQDFLNSSAHVPTSMGRTHVFLINEFIWLDILTNGDGFTVNKNPVGPGAEATKIFTTRLVLDNILSGNITFQQAVEKGLIASNCGIECVGESYGTLRIAMEIPRREAEFGRN